ncbi:hypothetical protein [Streptomyces abyssomicinicus]|uniref:hypothetical protein n=1 Tax=Streptomyces abyssomicinicus TaxID=574929 RepID=UPI0013DF4A5A|nr:hypothetical protein [Streptomyces abyssomicinicus]
MPHPSASTSRTTTAPSDKTQPRPFLLTARQGEAARTLLSYVTSLPLPGPAAQLLAVVAAIRAARGGVGHVTGADLAALRLGDARAAVDALRGVGWQVDEAVFDGDPAAPAGTVVVPELTARTAEHPLPFGKDMRSRVSGWVSRTLSAKPVRKLPPAGRLAGLFLAAHGAPELPGELPPHLPEACRPLLPELLERGFLAELSGDRYRLSPQVRHLNGLRPYEEEQQKADPTKARAFVFTEEAWAAWKDAGTPALRRHVESVEGCPLCALPRDRVAEAFMVPAEPVVFRPSTESAYGRWKEAHPDRGPRSAEFTVAFRAEHGHGPSFRQLFAELGWDVPKRPQLRAFAVGRLTSNGWLTTTGQVPWTLRPGPAAQEQGITLPRARTSTAGAARAPR